MRGRARRGVARMPLLVSWPLPKKRRSGARRGARGESFMPPDLLLLANVASQKAAAEVMSTTTGVRPARTTVKITPPPASLGSAAIFEAFVDATIRYVSEENTVVDQDTNAAAEKRAVALTAITPSFGNPNKTPSSSPGFRTLASSRPPHLPRSSKNPSFQYSGVAQKSPAKGKPKPCPTPSILPCSALPRSLSMHGRARRIQKMEPPTWPPLPKQRRTPRVLLETVAGQVAEDEGDAITKAAAAEITTSSSFLSAAASEVHVDKAAATEPGAPAAALAPISGDAVAVEGGLKRRATAAAEGLKTYKRRKRTTAAAEGERGCDAACGRVEPLV